MLRVNRGGGADRLSDELVLIRLLVVMYEAYLIFGAMQLIWLAAIKKAIHPHNKDVCVQHQKP